MFTNNREEAGVVIGDGGERIGDEKFQFLQVLCKGHLENFMRRTTMNSNTEEYNHIFNLI